MTKQLTISGRNVDRLAKILGDGTPFVIKDSRKKDTLTFDFNI